MVIDDAVTYLEDVLGPDDSQADKHYKRPFDMGYEPAGGADDCRLAPARGKDRIATIAYPRMGAEAVRWAPYTAGHILQPVVSNGQEFGAGPRQGQRR